MFFVKMMQIVLLYQSQLMDQQNIIILFLVLFLDQDAEEA